MNALRNNGLDGHSSGSYEPPPKRSRTATFQPCKGDHCSLSCQIADILSVIEVMKVQQATTYKSFHYLEQTKVSAEDRKALCQWGFDIMDACKLNHDVAMIAIGYFDRFLSKRGLPVVEACLDNQREFQLAFVTCLVLALKGRAGMGIEPKFVAEAMCEGMYLPEEIIALEIDILRTLGWRLNGPTASDFIKHFIELLPTGFDEEVASSLHDLACEKVKMGLLDYRLSLELPSHLALASISSLFQDINDEEQEKLGLSSWISRISCLMATSGLGAL